MISVAVCAADRPNVIVIMADDLGFEAVGAYGSTCRTPVLDKMAAEGMRFDHCYAQPLCTPSRVKIMTGISNARNYLRFGTLPWQATTFAHLFKNAGYATCIAGKWQLGRDKNAPRHFGFDESCLWQHFRPRTKKGGFDTRFPNPQLEINGKEVDHKNGEFGPDIVAKYLCDFIDRNKEKPFLVYYPMILTHCPFVPTPDTPDWDPQSQGFKGYKGDAKYFPLMATHMDKMIGRIIKQLEESGVRGKTLILFTGDNGTDKPVKTLMKDGRKIAGGKGSMTDAGTHVPLIVNWPGKVQSGKVSTDLVDLSDFLPTICEAADVEVPADLKIDGRSFFPQLTGKPGKPRKAIYMWYQPNGQTKGAKIFARTQRYKLYSTGKFYDISKDIHEKENLGDSAPSDVRAMLQQLIDNNKDVRDMKKIRNSNKK